MTGYRPRPVGPIAGLPADRPTLRERYGEREIVPLSYAMSGMSGQGEKFDIWMQTGRGSPGAGVYYEVQEADMEPTT